MPDLRYTNICTETQEEHRKLLAEKFNVYVHAVNAYTKNISVTCKHFIFAVVTVAIVKGINAIVRTFTDLEMPESTNSLVNLSLVAYLAKLIADFISLTKEHFNVIAIETDLTTATAQLEQEIKCISKHEIRTKCGLDESFEIEVDSNLIPTNLPDNCSLTIYSF